jgi:hypothetical protein
MKAPSKLVLITLVSQVMVATTFAANLIVNAGFEDPITQDGAPFVGSWEGFNAGAGSLAGRTTILPHSGLQSLDLAITSTDNAFAGAFQDVTGLTAGLEYVFSGWHVAITSPLDLTAEIRIEWRNSISNTEIGRTPNLSPVPPLESYAQFSLTGAVPVGADTARLVYAIQTFTGGPSNNGRLLVDDVSFQPVPEPSTMILLGVAGLAVLAVRRKSA